VTLTNSEVLKLAAGKACYMFALLVWGDPQPLIRLTVLSETSRALVGGARARPIFLQTIAPDGRLIG